MITYIYINIHINIYININIHIHKHKHKSPHTYTGVSTRTRNVFIAANAAGAVQHWHMTSGKCLHTFEDDDNQVFALNYNKGKLHIYVILC